MALVTVNQAAIARLLNSTVGPVGREVGRKADQVGSLASNNASGSVLNIDSGRLLSGIRTHLTTGLVEFVSGTPQIAVFATVGTDAVKISRTWPQGFSYPAFHDVAGENMPHGGQHRWLTQALREVFP